MHGVCIGTIDNLRMTSPLGVDPAQNPSCCKWTRLSSAKNTGSCGQPENLSYVARFGTHSEKNGSKSDGPGQPFFGSSKVAPTAGRFNDQPRVKPGSRICLQHAKHDPAGSPFGSWKVITVLPLRSLDRILLDSGFCLSANGDRQIIQAHVGTFVM